MVSRIQRWFGICLMVVTLALVGCSPETTSTASTTSPSPIESPTPVETTPMPTNQASSQFSNLPRLEGDATVVLTINGSPVTIAVDGKNAPITAGNFVDLVQRGVYDGLIFHRVVREPQPFVVQGGDPQGKDPNFSGTLGTGGFIDPATSRQRMIPLEIKPQGSDQLVYSRVLRDAGITAKPQLPHRRGAVAMARAQNPDSASSQFYIALADLDFLDGSYAVFGYVTEGMEVVDKIQQGDKIGSAQVTQGLDNLKNGGSKS